MRTYSCHAMTVVAALCVALAATACSSDADTPEPSTGGLSAGDNTAAAQPSSTVMTSPAVSGAVGVSPGGVTTSVGAGAESLEEEYFQACHTARVWMDAQGGDAHALIEPYLRTIQSEDSAGPGTFGTPWSQLSPGRQAAVIVAVQAASDALCG